MNILYFRFTLFDLKIFLEIFTSLGLLFEMKLLIADKFWRNNKNCVIIVAFMLKRSRHSWLQSFLNYASIVPKRRKHKSSTEHNGCKV